MNAALLAAGLGPLTLHFTDWQCGHHGQRPANIPVSSPEQALLILQAISHAITQPGHAHAVLMSERFAEAIVLLDDHLAIGMSGRSTFRDINNWAERPVVVFGNAAEIAEIHSPHLAMAAEGLGYSFEQWDGASTVDGGQQVTTTLGLADLVAMSRLVEWDEASQRAPQFDLPPVLMRAGELLVKLRAEAAQMASEGS